MLKRILLIGILLLGICQIANAIEVVRQKNAATYIAYPMIDVDGDIVTGAGSLDSEIDAFADGSAPNGFVDCTNEAIEIGSSGWYYLSLTQTEMNNDMLIVTTSTTTTDAKTQHILIRTQVGDPLNVATTDDGGTINVTSGKVDEVAALTSHTAQTGDSYAIVNSGTHGNSAIETLVDDLESRLTAARAGYLDKLNVSGALAHSDAASTYKATGFSTHTAAGVWSVGTRTLTGTADANLTQIEGHALAGTGTQIADGLEYFFNVATPAKTMNDVGVSGSGLTAQEVWEYNISAIATAGYSGDYLNNLPGDPADDSDIDSQLAALQTDLDNPTQYKATGFSTHAAADIWAVGTRTLTAGTKDAEIDNIVTYTGTTIPGMITTNSGTLNDIEAYIDTEVAAILEDTGTTLPASLTTIQADLDSTAQYKADVSALATSAALATAQADLDNVAQYKADVSSLATSAALATAQADLDNPSQYKADVSGVATAVNLATVDTVVDAIKAKTDNLPTDPADDSDIDGQLATIQADLDNPTQYKATGYSTHSAADVWTSTTRTLSAFSFTVGLTSAAVDSIWDEVITGHSTADSFGKVIDDQIDGLRAYGDSNWIKGTTIY